MRNILSRPVVACAVAVCAAAAIPTASAAASTPHAPILIGPNQPFSGYINGHPPGQAVIQTTCAGPVLPGETGNPLPNQTVEVKLGVTSGSTDSGYTGTAANNIRATLGTATGSAPVVIADFTAYNVIKYIPTNIQVPCAGPGVATFVPRPTSPTARSAKLSVSFLGQP